MALVDYSSSDSEPEAAEAASATAPAAKKQKTSADSTELPPLPDAFHDLYASTVRVSTSDDPTLHQGRKRVNPHRVGSWPSHLYIEWHPTTPQRTALSTLLSDLQTALTPLSVNITSFLTSDLGTPQPLHISLSRPIVLSTTAKDDFLEKLVSRIKSSGIGPFDLAPRGLEWHRTSESERSFLVLRVGRTASPPSAPGPAPSVAKEESTKRAARSGKAKRKVEESNAEADALPNNPSSSSPKQQHNPELAALLQRCNALVQEHQQPPLYAFAGGSDDAFHISVAWSFAEPSLEVRQHTERIFAAGPQAEVLAMRVPVRGVKAKIGNVITNVELPVRGKRGTGE